MVIWLLPLLFPKSALCHLTNHSIYDIPVILFSTLETFTVLGHFVPLEIHHLPLGFFPTIVINAFSGSFPLSDYF